jgi:hypothetical protein
MRNSLTLAALVGVTAVTMAAQSMADTFSNRHHLSGCTDQSAPVIIPYADARTVRLGLPADLEGRSRITEIYGYEEDTRLRLRRRGLSVHTQGGGAILEMQDDEDDC